MRSPKVRRPGAGLVCCLVEKRVWEGEAGGHQQNVSCKGNHGRRVDNDLEERPDGRQVTLRQ